MENGVLIINFDDIYIDVGVKIGVDMIIELGVLIKGYMIIGEDCFIGVYFEIYDMVIEDCVWVMVFFLEDFIMYVDSNIGLYSYLWL